MLEDNVSIKIILFGGVGEKKKNMYKLFFTMAFLFPSYPLCSLLVVEAHVAFILLSR
jgi:hypothetical protein